MPATIWPSCLLWQIKKAQGREVKRPAQVTLGTDAGTHSCDFCPGLLLTHQEDLTMSEDKAVSSR